MLGLTVTAIYRMLITCSREAAGFSESLKILANKVMTHLRAGLHCRGYVKQTNSDTKQRATLTMFTSMEE
jgi:hypothetical protein